MQPRTVRLPGADDLELNTLQWSQDGTPMLLLHGFGNEAHIWDDFAPVVAPHYRVMAWPSICGATVIRTGIPKAPTTTTIT